MQPVSEKNQVCTADKQTDLCEINIPQYKYNFTSGTLHKAL